MLSRAKLIAASFVLLAFSAPLCRATHQLEAADNYFIHNKPSAILIADFNGDGWNDIAIEGDSGPEILLNAGNGTFPTERWVNPHGSGGMSTTAIATADFDGDGHLDLLVAGYQGAIDSGSCFHSSNCYGVFIYPGNGDGTFRTPVPVWESGAANWWAQVGDFNHDGRPDIVYSNDDGTGWTGLALNSGGYSFDTNWFGLTTGGPVAVGDFDLDGNLDLVFNAKGSMLVDVWWGEMGYTRFLPPRQSLLRPS